MRLYFDTAYVAKCYLNETDAKAVRKLATRATGLYSSAWCIPELACVFQRQIRESRLSKAEAAQVRALFLEDVGNGVWSLLPLSESFLHRVESLVASLPTSLYLRAGDAIHLAAAQGAGFSDIWSNDRRLLDAAAGFGLTGRSV
ncbi:MAG: type II toxin-antitoxin system VapC family toxin [Acidobacteriia bacterium]|nr:type II toxin-antitoxin system VapC family toxin [Terriglobia bacterium]